MKRFFSLGCFLICFLVSTVVFAQEKSRVLIVFYSREGHTKLVAQKLAEKFSADLEQLIDKKNRIGPIAIIVAGKDATVGNFTEIGVLAHNPNDYDMVLIGTPGWFGNVTPAVRTFLAKYDVSAKKIGIFGTSHLSGIENALKQVSELTKQKDPQNIPVLPLHHADLKDEILNPRIDEFYRKLIP